MQTDNPETKGPAARRGLPGEESQRQLARLSQLSLEGTRVPDLAREVAETAAEVLGADLVYVMELLPEARTLQLKAGVGCDENLLGSFTVPVGPGSRLGYVSQAGLTMISDEPVVVRDLHAEGSFEGCELLKRHGVRSGITVRVTAKNMDHDYGILGVHCRESREWTQEEEDWLSGVGRALGAAAARSVDTISRAEAGAPALRDAEEARRAARQASRRTAALKHAMAILASAPGPHGSLDAAAALAVRGPADWCFVDLLENGGRPIEGTLIRRVVVRAADADHADLARGLARSYPFDPTVGVGTQLVMSTARPQLLETIERQDLEAVAHSPEYLELLLSFSWTSCATVPLVVRGTAVGAIALLTTGERRLGPADVDFADDLAGIAACVLQGSLDRPSAPDDDRRAIRALARSEPSVAASTPPDSISDSVAGTLSAPPPAPERQGPYRPILTPRQREILSLAAQGNAHSEIARELHLSPRTVEHHLVRAATALGTKTTDNKPNTTRTVNEAVRRGEILPPP